MLHISWGKWQVLQEFHIEMGSKKKTPNWVIGANAVVVVAVACQNQTQWKTKPNSIWKIEQKTGCCLNFLV